MEGDSSILLTIPTDDSGDYELICSDEEFASITPKIMNGLLSVFAVVYGDVNTDGKVNVIDANLIRRYAARMTELDDYAIACADVNGDTKVNIMDANLIRRYAAKLIDSFPLVNAG